MGAGRRRDGETARRGGGQAGRRGGGKVCFWMGGAVVLLEATSRSDVDVE